MTPPARSASRRGAFALVAVLWVVIVASLILLAVRKNSWSNAAMAKNYVAAVQARWLARAGVEQAMAVLADDLRDSDGQDDLWYDSSEDFEQVALATGTFTVTAPHEQEGWRTVRFGLVDHAALLNLSTADANQLAGFNEMTESQVESILDWLDSDDEIRSGGAEAGYYNRLDLPYEIRNGPLATIGELMLIKDIDEQTFYGEDRNLNGILDADEDDGNDSPPPDDRDGKLHLGLAGLCTIYSYEHNVSGAGQERINFNTATRSTLTDELSFSPGLAREVTRRRRGRQFKSLTDLVGLRGQGPGSSGGRGDSDRVNEITIKWLAEHFDSLTVSDQARLPGSINVNTAPRDVLLTLPGMTAETAEAIVQRRSSATGAYTSAGELLGAPLTEQQFRAAADRVSVRSSVFEIHSRGTTRNGVQHEIVAIVDRDATPMSVLYWYEAE